jgi:peptide/nickel transport system substrate-binding protein
LKYPQASFLSSLASPWNFIYKADILAKDIHWYEKNVMGTGPFMFGEHVKGSHWVGKKNPNYWDKGKPYLDSYRALFIKDSAAQVAAVRGGRAHIQFRGFSPVERDTLVQTLGNKITVQESPWDCALLVAINHEKKPFDDKRVRQAVAYAFPYQDIIQNVWYGYADPMTSFIPQGMPTHDDSAWVYKTDIAKAKQLLSDAGLADGFDTRLIVNPANVEDSGSAVWIQSGLAKAGIRVMVDKQNEAAYNAALFSTRDAPLFLFNWISYVNDPFYHAFFLLKSDAGTNFSNWKNPQVDNLIMSGMYEGDAAKRESISKQIQSITADETPWVYMAQPKLALGMRDNVKGYAHFFDEIMRFWYLYKAA